MEGADHQGDWLPNGIVRPRLHRAWLGAWFRGLLGDQWGPYATRHCPRPHVEYLAFHHCLADEEVGRSHHWISNPPSNSNSTEFPPPTIRYAWYLILIRPISSTRYRNPCPARRLLDANHYQAITHHRVRAPQRYIRLNRILRPRCTRVEYRAVAQVLYNAVDDRKLEDIASAER